MSEPVTAQSFQVPESVDVYRSRAAIVAAVGVAAMVAGYFVDPARFFQAYLVAFIFWTCLSLGCLGLMMVHHLSGGQWGLVIRRLLEAGSKVLPAMALLFLPLLLGLSHVYQWAQPELVAADPILQHKVPFLNAPFWTIRTLGYFAIWSGMALLLIRWSTEQDALPGAPLDRRFGRLSGPGLVVFGLTLSLASIDWMMSVDPHWFSTIYGFVMIGGAGLSALALIIGSVFVLMKTQPMANVVQPKHVHDLGKLLFAFVMLYAYFIFSQFLIIWSANLPEEIPWYLKRFAGGWEYVIGLLVIGHFALPFAILLSADVKQSARRLTAIAGLLLVMRFIDIYFQVMPQFSKTLAPSWIDLAAAVGIGGLWFSVFLFNLKGRPLLPVNDPYLGEVLAHHGSH